MTFNMAPAKPVVPFSSNVRYECGCGFKTQDMNAAIEHCITRKHTMSAAGMIRYHRHIPASKMSSVVESQKSTEYCNVSSSKFDELQAKLNSIR